MIINTFIAAIVAMFFWKKTSKDIEEQTELASWTRTIVYGVLTFSVLVFYIKTYQVATINQTIQVAGFKGNFDKSSNSPKDIVTSIDVLNRFSTGITENTFKNQLSEEDREHLDTIQAGGIFVSLRLTRGENDTIKNFSKYDGIATKGYPIPLKNFVHAYEIQYITNTLPSLIPLFIKKNEDEEGIHNKTNTYYRLVSSDYNSYDGGKFAKITTYDSNGNQKEINAKKFDAYLNRLILTDTMQTNGYRDYEYETKNNYINKFGFFTAADISQYTYAIKIKSDLYIKELFVGYDLPIEINPYSTDMQVSSNSFIVKGKLLNEEMKNQSQIDYYCFHVKFPTLANLQLIRSLILTTLLTALVSLFFMNLFYRLRKHFISFRDNHILEISNDRVKTFRKRMGILLYLVLFAICYVAWCILIDNPFRISKEQAEFLYSYYGRIILGITIVGIIIIYILFRKAYTIKKKDKKK